MTSPSSKEQTARAAYYAICLDLAPSLRQKHPEQWANALDALNSYENVVQAIFHHAPRLWGRVAKKAIAAGLTKPPARKELW